jgi:hypothetical protein
MNENIIQTIDSLFPVYECVLPFSQKTVKFTPFKVKDAKIMALISEEKNKKLILNSLIDLLKNKTKNVDIMDLCLADAEYLFLKIRSKSVGEHISLIVENKNVNLNIDEIKTKNTLSEKEIKISSALTLKLRVPKLKNLIDINLDNKEEYINSMIFSAVMGNEYFDLEKFVPEKIKEIIDNLPLKFLNELDSFYKEQPQLYIKLDNDSNEREVQGILTFFTLQ